MQKRLVYFTDDMSKVFAKYLDPKEVRSIRRETFPDQTPNIFIEGLSEISVPTDIVYFTQYTNMAEKKTEEMIIYVLSDTLNVNSLTIVDLFDPLATMERIGHGQEGQVATANVDAHFWKTLPLPDSGKKIRRILFDHHTLHNRFYYSGGNTRVIFKSAMPLLFDRFSSRATCVAFPDEGAYKRFGPQFSDQGFEAIICGKVREGDSRIVKITDAPDPIPIEKDVIIVDDLVRTGGTLKACASTLKNAGFRKVFVFVTHAQFPQETWKSFLDFEDIDHFYTTDTVPAVSSLLDKHIGKFTIFSIFNMIKNEF